MTAQLFNRTSTSLRIRLLAIIVILIAPIAIFDAVGLLQVRATRIRITQERAYELAKAGAARYQDTIDDVHTVLDMLSRVPDARRETSEACSNILRDIAAAHKWARSLSLIGENQRVACSSNPAAVAYDVSNRSWFQAARNSGGFNVSGFFINQVSGLPTAFAVLFYRNSLTGEAQALLASLDLAWFDRLAATFGEKQNALVLLVDSEGVVLSRYPMSPTPGHTRVSSQFLNNISASSSGLFAGSEPDGGERLFGSVALPEAHAHVVVGFDRAATLGLIDKYTLIAAMIFGSIMLLAGYIVWVIGDKIFVRPIEQLNGLLRTTFDTMDQGLIAIDRHGRSSIINERALDLLELPREFAATRPHKDKILEYQRDRGEFSSEEQYASVVDDIDHRRHGIYERERPNGTVLEIRTVPTTDGGFVRTYSDITARRAIEAALRQERDRAEAAARATADFLTNMSHELRTPLTAIIGVSDVLLSGPLSPERQRHFMEMQRKAGKGLLSVINDILDFSKIEAGQLDLEAIPVSLREIADDCIRLVADPAQRKGLNLTATVAEDVPFWVTGDPTRLRHVLLNLVANGVKFTRTGSVTLTIDRVTEATNELRFSVADTGIGIRSENLATLFERFTQAERSTTRQFGGTGLGLAISKQLVALMGGVLEVESELGRGTIFSFVLELPPAPEAVLDPAAPYPRLTTSYRLLLAEDNELSQQLIKTVLEQRGHQVVVVSDGAEAVRAAIRCEFDAILMDVKMPGMDGYAAARAIRNAMQDMPTLPIIALTANALSDEVERCTNAGMNVHVPKPVNWPELFSAIDRLILIDRETRGRHVPIIAMTANVLPRQIETFRAAGMNAHVGKPFRREELIGAIEQCLSEEQSREAAGSDQPTMWSFSEDDIATPVPSPAKPDVLDEVKFEQLRMQIGVQNSANLLRMFAVDAPKYFVVEGDEPDLGRKLTEEAHSLGGSAGLLGFDELMEACRHLEVAAAWGEALEETYLPQVRQARERALGEIARLLSDDGFAGPLRTTA